MRGAELMDHFIDVAAILNGHARAESHGCALRVERGLADGGLGKHNACVVLIPVNFPALESSSRIALDQHSMTVFGLDVEHHVGLLGKRERPPGDMADDHLAVAWAGPVAAKRCNAR